jgi:molybdate transport system ATP-binding protein
MTDAASGLKVRLRRVRGNFALDADFSAPPHGITALFGASGAGKTSCLRAIAGLDRDVDGRVDFSGKVWLDSTGRRFVPPHRRGIGYVFQEPSLFPHLSVTGNLDYGQQRSPRLRNVDRRRLIEQFGIDRLLARKPKDLSGGERQRVALARALLADPVLLMLDEPLSALDATAREELLGCLKQLHAELAIPMIYVSHAIDEVLRLASHVVVMHGGRVVAQGSPPSALPGGDLRPAVADPLGGVIEGHVVAQDPFDHLSELAFAGGRLWLPRRTECVGDRLRCRIDARDIVLSTRAPVEPADSFNVIETVVIGLTEAAHPSHCLVRLDARGTLLLAHVARRCWRALALSPGQRVWAQVKVTMLDAPSRSAVVGMACPRHGVRP